MTPQFSQGVFSQKWWRPKQPTNDIDDCVVLADIACLHACAPWEKLPSITTYREAAGNPDAPTPDGLTVEQSEAAIRTLWPQIGTKIVASKGTMTWASFLSAVKSGKTASVAVFSAAMATKNGAPVRHRISVFWTGTTLRIVNPIRDPHTVGTDISEAALKKAMDDYPDPGLFFVLFPTVAIAFTTHPLYQSAVDKGYEQAQAAAIKAVQGI